MSEKLRAQIYQNFDNEETEKLIDIWIENDRVEWSDLAFDVLEEILKGRIDNLPAQSEAIFEKDDQQQENFFDKIQKRFSTNEGIDDYLADRTGQEPVFYNPEEVFKVYHWLNILAKVAIPITIIVSLFLVFGTTKGIIKSYFINSSRNMDFIVWIITLAIFLPSTALSIAIYYYPLKALAFILKILMELERNSSRVVSEKEV